MPHGASQQVMMGVGGMGPPEEGKGGWVDESVGLGAFQAAGSSQG